MEAHPRYVFLPRATGFPDHQALQSASGKNKLALSPERAYCLFRLERLDEALNVTREKKSGAGGGKRVRALRHLEAQVGVSHPVLAISFFIQGFVPRGLERRV